MTAPWLFNKAHINEHSSIQCTAEVAKKRESSSTNGQHIHNFLTMNHAFVSHFNRAMRRCAEQPMEIHIGYYSDAAIPMYNLVVDASCFYDLYTGDLCTHWERFLLLLAFFSVSMSTCNHLYMYPFIFISIYLSIYSSMSCAGRLP